MKNSIYTRIMPVLTTLLILAFGLTTFAQETTPLAASPYPQTLVKLTPCYKTPSSLKNKHTRHIQGLGYGEYVELKVIGTIQNVRLVSLTYNEVTNTLEESTTTATIDKLTDQSLIISTYIPCGMAQEKLIWESLSGEEDSFLIAEDGATRLKTLTYTYVDPFETPKLIGPPALPIHFLSPRDIPAEAALYFMIPLVKAP